MEGCQADGDGAGIFVYKGNLQSNATAAWPEQLVQIGFTVLCPGEVATSEDMLFENCSSGAYGGVHAFAGPRILEPRTRSEGDLSPVFAGAIFAGGSTLRPDMGSSVSEPSENSDRVIATVESNRK